MSTHRVSAGISEVLFGKTRQAVLGLLYGQPDKSFYLREIVRAAHAGQGAVQRELKQLSEAGVVRRWVRGRQVYFQANRECPIFRELRGLVTKTVGLVEVLRAALAPLASRVKLAFVYGSLARGDDRAGSDVDLLVIGEVSFAEVVEAISLSQDRLGRETNPTVYPESEFRERVASRQHFLETVVHGPKIFLVGGEDELARLAPKRLARRASHKSAGDRRSARSG